MAAGDDRRVEGLLFSNADRLARESIQGNTPLHEAASRGFSRCVKLICAPPPPAPGAAGGKAGKGAKGQQKDKEKNKAKAKVIHQTTEALHNSSLSIANNEGLSALHLAAQNGHNQSSRELLLAGADPDVQNNVSGQSLVFRKFYIIFISYLVWRHTTPHSLQIRACGRHPDPALRTLRSQQDQSER